MTWTEVPLRSLYRRVEELGRPDLPLLSVYRDYGVVPREGREDNYNKPSADLSGYKIVQRCDLVINKMKAWQGSLGVSDHDGIVSPAYFVCRPIGDVDHRFVHHLLRSSPLIAEYGARSKGIRPSQWDLPWNEFASIKVRLPTSDTQRRLASHLDTETARIDALISKKRHLIELLRERWRAEITDTVFSNTSLPWVALRHVVNLLPGFAFPSSDYVDDGIRLLRGINVTTGRLRWNSDVVYLAAENRPYTSEYELAEGDIVLGMDRPVVGSGLRIALVSTSDLPCQLVQRVARIRGTKYVDTPYIRFAIDSDAFIAYFSPIVTGVSVPHISADQILSFRVPLPSSDAQRTLATKLTQKQIQLAATCDRLNTQIDLLAERRRALITAVVEGEMPVPTLVT